MLRHYFKDPHKLSLLRIRLESDVHWCEKYEPHGCTSSCIIFMANTILIGFDNFQ